jgi:plasmid maintenance system antidote protein VapI
MPHSRLPAAPLKRVLNRLQASESLTWEDLADRIGVTVRQLCRILTAVDLSEQVADRIACRIGLHPLLLWPKEWSQLGIRRSRATLGTETGANAEANRSPCQNGKEFQ